LKKKTFVVYIEIYFRFAVKKNNVEWLDDNKKLHYSVERSFLREGEFNETLLNQEGAFVDILRVVYLEKKIDFFFFLFEQYSF
jgi:hypothetical protein